MVRRLRSRLDCFEGRTRMRMGMRVLAAVTSTVFFLTSYDVRIPAATRRVIEANPIHVSAAHITHPPKERLALRRALGHGFRITEPYIAPRPCLIFGSCDPQLEGPDFPGNDANRARTAAFFPSTCYGATSLTVSAGKLGLTFGGTLTNTGDTLLTVGGSFGIGGPTLTYGFGNVPGEGGKSQPQVFCSQEGTLTTPRARP